MTGRKKSIWLFQHFKKSFEKLLYSVINLGSAKWLQLATHKEHTKHSEHIIR